MIAWILAFALVLSLLALIGLIYEVQYISRIYESTYQLLIRERDLAREDAATMRAAIFPQLRAKKESEGAVPLQVRQAPKPKDSDILNRRIPWRMKAKQLTALHAHRQPEGKSNG